LIRKAIELNPRQAAAHSNLGIILLSLHRSDEALAQYDQAIALQPDYAEALYNRGVLLHLMQRDEAALASLDKAIEVQRDFVAAHVSRGEVLVSLRRFETALESYDRAIVLDPNHADVHNHRGKALSSLQRHDEACESYGTAIRLQPDHAEVYNNRASALWQLDRYAESLAHCDHAIALKPDYAEAYTNRGNVLRDLYRFTEALRDCDKAIEINPRLAAAHANRANALRELQRYEEALDSCDVAIGLDPDQAEAHINRGNILSDLQRYEEALLSYDRSIALRPNDAALYWIKSLCLLRTARWHQGWELFEYRKRRLHPTASDGHPRPRWLGQEDLAGKTLYIYWEWGLGDTIQFCRYAAVANSLGATVIMSVQSPLRRLLTTIGRDTHIIGEHAMPAAFDYHCSMMGLPLAFRTTVTTIPNQVPYLTADPVAVAFWRKRLAGTDGMRVGLCWAGDPRHYHPAAHAIDLRRSISLARYAPLATMRGVTFVSLQKGEAAAQVATPPVGLALHDWTNELIDFADTAALVAALDLVITVDTSVAHLAGALGKPVWILDRYDACWRWLVDRDDSPWYPTARLWRQPKPGDWESVIADVVVALRDLVGRRPDRARTEASFSGT
jgi:hypothetical protein